MLFKGSRLGRYEVVCPIGAGGMGEVYKAHDTGLRRDVAIKILPPQASSDPALRARFEQEARAISQLNHPHICAVYDVGESDSIHYLVMEHLEGETLGDRLNRGPLSVETSLEYAMQIADALDKAHRRGIVHRDLKPANVMLTKSGAKLLDFGLAKLTHKGGITTIETAADATGQPLTAEGTILGTFQYMAPEQLDGRGADARSDIWAFGCVLYEMLTGRRTFDFKTQASLIAGILEREPVSVSELQPLTPPALARLVRTCLAKDPDDRFQSAHDILLQLRWIAEGGSAAGVAAPVVAQRRRHDHVILAAAVAASALITAAAFWLLTPESRPAGVTGRFAYALPSHQNLTGHGRQRVAVSPDGTKLAYVANNQMYLRDMNELVARPLAGTNEFPMVPVFSPDGQWLAYFAAASDRDMAVLKKVALSGGQPVRVATLTGWPVGAQWRDGEIVWAQSGPNGQRQSTIFAVADGGGSPRLLLKSGEGEFVGNAFVLRDGRHVVYSVAGASETAEQGDVVVQKLDGSARKVLVEDGWLGAIVDDRILVYQTGTNIFAVSFDASAGAIEGTPVPVADSAGAPGFGKANFGVSATGTLVFEQARPPQTQDRTLVWVSRDGGEEVITPRARPFLHPRLSPDGNRIAVVVSDERPLETHIWIWDLARGTLTRLTSGAGDDAFPVWSRDGRYVIYGTTDANRRRSFWRVRADGTQAPEKLIDRESLEAYPESTSANDSALIFRDQLPGTGQDVMSLSLAPGGGVTPVLQTRFRELNGQVSPDGRWIAYESDESGVREIYVRPYPNVGAGRWQVSSGTGGAESPFWARSSKEIYYAQRDGQMAAVPVVGTPASASPFGAPVNLFDRGRYFTVESPGVHTDVSARGRFLMMRRPEDQLNPTRPTLVIVTNWLDDARKKFQ